MTEALYIQPLYVEVYKALEGSIWIEYSITLATIQPELTYLRFVLRYMEQ